MWQIPVALSDLQQEGVKRLQESRASILADPPGAGKTWTTLGALAQDPLQPTRVLFVAPNQVLAQWQDEVEKIAKSESIILFPIKTEAEFNHTLFAVKPGHCMALFLSPTLMTRLAKTLMRFKLSHVVLDEVHLYSRPNTKGYVALKMIASSVSGRLWFLTANPIQNSYRELESLYRIAQVDPEAELEPIPMVRRRPDTSYLPEREDLVRTLRPDEKEKEDMDVMEEANREKIPIVKMIHQQMFGLRSEDSQKTRAVVEDCLRLKQEGRRSLVVLHRKKHFEVLKSALEKRGLKVDIWSGAISQKQRVDKLRLWQKERDSPFREKETKELLRMTTLKKLAIPDVASTITDYVKPAIPDVLLLQSRAGGVGLNLQMFQAVLLPSLDWNPCSEDQAVARVVRRGQTEASIPVIRYILEKSIDEKIMFKQEGKRTLAKQHLVYSA